MGNVPYALPNEGCYKGRTSKIGTELEVTVHAKYFCRYCQEIDIVRKIDLKLPRKVSHYY